METIKQQAGYNAPATEAQIRICNLKLRQHDLPELPADYAEMLKICNGLSNEDSLIYGAETGENMRFKDLASFNISYFRGIKSDWLILGEDDYSYFVYDTGQKQYHLNDRETFEEVYSSDDFSAIVEDLLKIE